jgi:hypothetical protein
MRGEEEGDLKENLAEGGETESDKNTKAGGDGTVSCSFATCWSLGMVGTGSEKENVV